MTLAEFITANPKTSIVVLSVAITFLLTLVRYFFTDRKAMAEIKDGQKMLKEEMKQHKDNPDKMMELNKQMMEHFPAQMKQSFKIMLITIVPMLILFWWLKGTFAGVLPHWIWWYIISSIVASLILGKIFKLD